MLRYDDRDAAYEEAETIRPVERDLVTVLNSIPPSAEHAGHEVGVEFVEQISHEFVSFLSQSRALQQHVACYGERVCLHSTTY